MQKLIVKRVSLRVIIILFLCSGLLVMNGLISNPSTIDAIGSSTSGCHDSRPVDTNYSSNDYKPVKIDNTQLASKYSNDGTEWIIFNVSVYDDDESNDTTIPPWNGTHIVSVTINLTEFGIPPQDMVYRGNYSLGNDYNASRLEGFFEYNFTIPSNFQADNYNITIKVIDNGKPPRATINNHVIKVYQYNRAPAYNATHSFAYTFHEDAYNTDPLEIDFNDLFSDADVDDGPFNNTDPDSLTFYFWFDGAWFSGAGIKYFENFTLQFNGSDCLWLKSVENKHVTGQTVNLSAMDAAGMMAEHLLIITITSVNDLPVLNGADHWEILTHRNVTIINETTVQCIQGKYVNLNITAFDNDQESLYFALEDFSPGSTALFTKPFYVDEMTGNLNFTPDNDAVGTFWVNISVRDSLVGYAQDWDEFAFEVLNLNDPPMITMVNNMAPVDKTVALNAMQDIKFTAVITAADLDVARGLYDDALTFKADATTLITNEDNVTANYTFTPTNDDVGDVVVNITVKDTVGIEIDDYVVAIITVADVNDTPKITDAIDELGSAISINDKMIDLTATPLTEIEPNVTFTLTAMDIDIPYGELLHWYQEDSTIPAAGYIIEKENNGQTARVIIVGEKLDNMVHIFNFTVIDDGTPSPLSDYVEVMVEVNITEEQPPGTSEPSVILEPYNPIIEPGDILILNGTIDYGNLDPSKIKVMIRISNADTELLLQAESIVKNGKFTYNYKIPEMINGNSTAGTWTIEIWATDGENNSSIVRREITIPANIPSPQDEEEELVMSMGLFSYDIFMIVGIFLVVFLIILALMILRKFKSEIFKPEEKQRANGELYIGEIEEPIRFEDRYDRF